MNNKYMSGFLDSNTITPENVVTNVGATIAMTAQILVSQHIGRTKSRQQALESLKEKYGDDFSGIESIKNDISVVNEIANRKLVNSNEAQRGIVLSKKDAGSLLKFVERNSQITLMNVARDQRRLLELLDLLDK